MLGAGVFGPCLLLLPPFKQTNLTGANLEGVSLFGSLSGEEGGWRAGGAGG